MISHRATPKHIFRYLSLKYAGLSLNLHDIFSIKTALFDTGPVTTQIWREHGGNYGVKLGMHSAEGDVMPGYY